MPRSAMAGVLFAAALLAAPCPAEAQWATVYEQTYLPASHNWAFRRNYAVADRLFNAFDYGHAILYETLHTRGEAAQSLLEGEIYDRLTKRILVRPPRVPLEEGAIEVAYAKLAPEAKAMFHWAHLLHRQTYDIWADERLSIAQKDRAVAEVLRYYRSRPDVAFSSTPKSMEIMDGQHFSLAFRQRFPRFNGLIWAYHWLQVGLYEPLLVGTTVDERQAMVKATVARFWQMLENAPARMPHLMPMTAAIAPTFAERYPEVAIIFDNLHMMHDVVSDILASSHIAPANRRAEILRAAAMFRDDTSYVTTVDEWRQMAVGMGVHNQGGPAIGLLGAVPTPTVPRGMSMAGMDHSRMGHEQHAPPDTAAARAEPRTGQAPPPTDPHAGHGVPPTPGAGTPAPDSAETRRAVDFILRLFADPQIEARIHADPRLHELWSSPEVQRQLELLRRTRAAPTADRPQGASPPATAPRPAGTPPPRPSPSPPPSAPDARP